jgi:dTDP-4-dehydrorhamnose reductase
MKIVLIGANGQLGTDIKKVFENKGIIGLTHENIQIENYNSVENMIKEYSPSIIINTAGYHNVPECEKNPEKSFIINSIAVKNLSSLCEKNDILLIHISTDYVFDGRKNTPYTEEDVPNPLNVYGISKLAGEFFVKQIPKYYIIRVASLFGKVGCRGKGNTNFVHNILDKAKTQNEIEVSSNIFMSPTYTYDAAEKIKEIIENNLPYGIYHVVNSGVCSWYEFALEIVKEKKLNVKILPKEETAILAGVRRPLYSALASNKISPLPHWKDALRRYFISC